MKARFTDSPQFERLMQERPHPRAWDFIELAERVPEARGELGCLDVCALADAHAYVAIATAADVSGRALPCCAQWLRHPDRVQYWRSELVQLKRDLEAQFTRRPKDREWRVSATNYNARIEASLAQANAIRGEARDGYLTEILDRLKRIEVALGIESHDA